MSARQRKLLNKFDFNGNTELFILEVKKNECLYNPEHPGYKNLATKARVWKEIGKKFSTKDDICKKRWKSLRDSYTKRIRNNEAGPSRLGDSLEFLAKYSKAIRKSVTQSTQSAAGAIPEEFDLKKVEVDCDQLIEEIKKRRCIWENMLPNPSVLTERNVAWIHITQSMCNGFKDLAPVNQRAINLLYREKWFALRMAYENSKVNSALTFGNAELALFEKLTFLDEIIADNNVEINSGYNDDKDIDEDTKIPVYQTIAADLKNEYYLTEIYATKERFREEQRARERALLSQNLNIEEEDNDDDRMFLLSLVNEMKNIPRDHKLDARLNILVVLKKWQKQISSNDPLVN